MEQNLNYYKIFFEVAKCGNISKAAGNLYISQPAVSKSISRLEQSLSHPLFIRNKRGVKLTEEGKTLYEYLEKAFDNIESAEKKLKQIKELGMGQLRIGASTSLCKYILLPYLQDFIKDNPHIKVSIDCKPTFETLKQLEADKIDIGLICETELAKEYSFMPIRNIHDTFVASKTYLNNLALRETDTEKKHNDNISTPQLSFPDNDNNILTTPNIAGLIMFSDHNNSSDEMSALNEKEILEKCNLMLLDKGNISRIYIDDYLNSNNIHPEQILEINNMDLLIDFAAIGMGVAGVVREFVSEYINNAMVIEIPMDYEISPRTIGFVYNSKNISKTTTKFLDSLT